MENYVTSDSLKLKLTLLKALKDGNIEQSQKLLEQLSKVNHSHPELYEKFHSFINEHKAQIIEDIKQQKQEISRPIIVDQLSEDSWVTDDSGKWTESEQEEIEEKEQKMKRVESRPKLLKNIANSKSAVHIKQIKEVKRPFHVQTKPKQNIHASTTNLRRKSSPNQKMINTTDFGVINLAKTSALSKFSSKKAIKPYFPPITANKPALRLN